MLISNFLNITEKEHTATAAKITTDASRIQLKRYMNILQAETC